jgi:hypothetical protein
MTKSWPISGTTGDSALEGVNPRDFRGDIRSQDNRLGTVVTRPLETLRDVSTARVLGILVGHNDSTLGAEQGVEQRGGIAAAPRIHGEDPRIAGRAQGALMEAINWLAGGRTRRIDRIPVR